MRPRGRPAGAAGNGLGRVLEMEVLLETVRPFEGDKTLHAHQILVVTGTVMIQRSLVALRLEADLAGVMAGPDVELELEEGGKVHPQAHLAGKPRPGGCGGLIWWTRADVGDERAVVEEHVLTDVADQHLGPVY